MEMAAIDMKYVHKVLLVFTHSNVKVGHSYYYWLENFSGPFFF